MTKTISFERNEEHMKFFIDAAIREQNEAHEIKVKERDDSVDIYVYDVISNYWGVTPNKFAHALKVANGRDINIYFNSPGGDVFAARAIYSQLERYGGKVQGYIDGMAASAATLIACACETREIAEGARFMIHRAWTITIGNSVELSDLAEYLSSIDDDLAQNYADVSGGTVKEMLAFMDKEKSFTAEEAVEAGLCNCITQKKAKANALDKNRERMSMFAEMINITGEAA